jgi:hypothetical protein
MRKAVIMQMQKVKSCGWRPYVSAVSSCCFICAEAVQIKIKMCMCATNAAIMILTGDQIQSGYVSWSGCVCTSNVMWVQWEQVERLLSGKAAQHNPHGCWTHWSPNYHQLQHQTLQIRKVHNALRPLLAQPHASAPKPVCRIQYASFFSVAKHARK